MNCIKCNAVVPDGSKFCPECGNVVAATTTGKCSSCGNDLANGARFCAVCGTPVTASAPAASQPAPVAAVPTPAASQPAPVAAVPTPAASQPAPVAAVPAPAASQPAPVAAVPTPAASQPAPVAAVPTPAASQPAPVASVPTPAASQPSPVAAVPAPAASQPAPVAAVPTPAASQPAPVAAVPVAAAPTPVNLSKNTAADANSFAAPTASFAAEQSAAQYGSTSALPNTGFTDISNASAVVAAPVKKKKVWLWIVIALVAVLAIGAGIIGLFFRGVAENIVLGDEKYATKIEANSIAMTMNSLSTDGKDAEAAKSELNQLSSDAISEMVNIYRAAEAAETTGEMSIDLTNFFEAYSKLYMETYGTNGASITYDLDCELTDAGKSALGLTDDAELDEMLTEVIDILNTIKLSAEAAVDSDRMMFQYGLDDGVGFAADVRITMYADGAMSLSLPGSTDKTLVVRFDTGEGTQQTTEDVDITIDYAEFEALVEDLTEIYLAAYAESEVEIEKAELKAAGVKAEGRLIVVEMDDKRLGQMLSDMIKLIADNEYLTSTILDIVDYCGLELTEEDYKAELDAAAKEIKDSVTVDLTVKTLVDNNSNVLGKSYALESDDSELEIAFVDGEEKAGSALYIDGEQYVTAVATKENETDGTIYIEISTDAIAIAANEADIDSEIPALGAAVGIKIEYKGAGVAKFGNTEVPVGDYSVYLAGTENSKEDGSAIKTGVNYSIDGNAYKCSMYMEVVGYGRLAFNTTTEAKNIEIADVPADALDMTETDTWTEEQNKEAIEYLKAALTDIKDAWSSDSSTISGYVVPVIEEAIASLEDALVEKADYEQIIQLAERIYEPLADLEDKYFEAYSYYSEEELEDIAALYEEMYYTYSSLYLYDELTMDEYNVYSEKADALIADAQTACADLDTMIEAAKNAETSETGEATGTVIEGEPIDEALIYGTWDLSYMEMEGFRMTAEEMSLGEYSITINQDGTASCTYFEWTTNGTWNIDDTTLTVIEIDEEFDYTVETMFKYVNGELICDDGFGTTIAFVKR